MAALATAGIDRQTLVIFMSDNGPWLEKGAQGGSAGPLRGGKNTAYEGGVRVPFIARWPGHVPRNRTVGAPAMNIDLYPTFVGLAGLPLENPAHFDGKDIGPMLLGKGGRDGSEFLIYHMTKMRAFRSGRWKVKFDPTGRPGQLFDLSVDPGETKNLATTEVARLLSLTTRARQLDANVPRDSPPKT